MVFSQFVPLLKMPPKGLRIGEYNGGSSASIAIDAPLAFLQGWLGQAASQDSSP